MKAVLMFQRILERTYIGFAAAFLIVQLSSSVVAQQAEAANKSATPSTSKLLVPVVVELFTSEGCSSCPPADVILQRLDEFQPIPGAQLIVLSEHVTYWDHDGWKDPNSSPIFTERQSSYESTLGEKEPYTPQFVIDGAQSVSLEHPQSLEDALTKAKTDPRVPLTISGVEIDPADPMTLRAHLEIAANFDKHSADIYVAVALNRVESQVMHGENGGKHLVHVAVLRQLRKVGKLSSGKAFAEDIRLRLESDEQLKDLRIVAFAQESGPGKLVAATMWKPAN